MGGMLCEIGVKLGVLVPRCDANVKVSNCRDEGVELSQMANGISADAAIRCPCTRNLIRRRVDQTNQNCIEKTDSEKESLTRSRRTNDQEPRSLM